MRVRRAGRTSGRPPSGRARSGTAAAGTSTDTAWSAASDVRIGVDDVADDADRRVLLERDRARSRTAPCSANAGRNAPPHDRPGEQRAAARHRSPRRVRRRSAGHVSSGYQTNRSHAVAARDHELAARRAREVRRGERVVDVGEREVGSLDRHQRHRPSSARACSPCARCTRRTPRPRSSGTCAARRARAVASRTRRRARCRARTRARATRRAC